MFWGVLTLKKILSNVTLIYEFNKHTPKLLSMAMEEFLWKQWFALLIGYTLYHYILSHVSWPYTTLP